MPPSVFYFRFLSSSREGPAAGRDLGERLFSGASLAMWDEALRSAPPHAIALSLQALKVTDGRDPASNIVWCPASHLATSPRPYTRLLGLTSRSWPRSENDDPLIPDHILTGAGFARWRRPNVTNCISKSFAPEREVSLSSHALNAAPKAAFCRRAPSGRQITRFASAIAFPSTPSASRIGFSRGQMKQSNFRMSAKAGRAGEIGRSKGAIPSMMAS